MTTSTRLRIDGRRLLGRLDELAEIGTNPEGTGATRLALTDEDGRGRDLVVSWMRDLGLRVDVDGIGNIVGTHPADRHDPPVMAGSHIDTVRGGGQFDGNLGVLAGLEALETIIAAGIEPTHPLAVAIFTDEEGARFPPDMLGSLVFSGGLPLEGALDICDPAGRRLGDELERIGYVGTMPCPAPPPHAYVELHIEQGPVLEAEGIAIGAVTGVQGIKWSELTITGQSNHAGTTPMRLRHDAGYAAASVATFLRGLATSIGPTQVATVGRIELGPGLINVIAGRATMTVDLRNTDADQLAEAEQRLLARLDELAEAEGVTIERTVLADFAPVDFDERVIALVEEVAVEHERSVKRLPSGAGHDAQMIATMCPSGMIFVPSRDGISHNPREFTEPEQVVAGADVLLDVLVRLATGARP